MAKTLKEAPITTASARSRLPAGEYARRLDADTVASAVRAFEAALEPPSDLHASADYRRSLAGTLLERALMRTL